MDLEHIQTFIAETLSIEKELLWLVELSVIIFMTLMLSQFSRFLLNRLEEKLKRTRTEWDDIAVGSIRKPVRALIWVLGLSYAISIIYKETDLELLALNSKVRSILIIWIAAWAIIRFTRRFSAFYIRSRPKADKTTVIAVTKVSNMAVMIAAGLVAIQTLGFSVSGILAMGGIGGIAVGFAAQGLLSNFFGAMMIYLDKPFKVGDWIRSPDQEIEGTVEDIGWRVTTIRTFDKRPLYVPNSAFTTISIENPSRMTHRRIYETVGIRYDDLAKMDEITADVRQMLIEHEDIDEKETMIVNFNAFNDSSCDFFVYTFTHTRDWIKFHEVKQNVLLKIASIVEKHGADIAYPTQTLHISELEKLAANAA